MQSFNPFIEIFNKVVKPDFKKLPQETKWMIDDLKKNYKELIWYVFISLLIVSIQTNILADYTSEELGMLEIYRLLNYSIVNNWLISFIVLVTISYIYIYKIYALQLVPTIISRIRFCLIIVLYIFIFRQSNIFYSFEDYSSIYYIDALIFCLGAFSLNLKPYQSYKPISDSIFIEENAELELNKDKFKRAEYSIKIAEEINNLKSKNSFSIAVVGEWGNGKSTFMHFLQINLKNDKNVIIHYNPWNYKNMDLMLDDFFTSFSNKIGEIDHDLKSSIVKYSKYLTTSEYKDNWFVKTMDFIISFIDEQKSGTEQLKEINDRLEQTGKKFIVFIDDIDRLTGEEIFQILKLLRTSANFKNVIFITGIDLEYVQQSIEKSSLQIHKSDKYLNKIFQLEIFLPPYDKSIVLDEIFKSININHDHKVELDNYFNSFSHFNLDSVETNAEIFKMNIDSLRDINRYVNSFKLTYSLVSDYVKMKDLFLIELLKIKYPIIYQKIASKEYLFFKVTTDTSVNSNGQHFDVNFDAILLNHYEGQKQNIVYNKLESLLKNLYSIEDRDINNYKSAVFKNKHQTYYNYLTIGLISGNEFTDLWNYDLDFIKKKVTEYFLQNKQEDFYKQVELFSPKILNKEIFEKLIIILAEFSQTLFQRGYIIDRIINWEKYKQNLSLIGEKDSNSFIGKILADEHISLINRIYLCRSYLYEIIKKNPFTKPEFKLRFIEINRNLFKEYLEKCTKISYEVFQVYYSIIEDITGNDSIILDKETNKLYKKFVSSLREDYLKILLRPLYSPPNERYVFEPFLKQTFGDDEGNNGFENFENFVDDFDDNDEDKKKLKAFIREKFEEYKISESVPKSVKLNEEQIKYLNEIQAKFKTE